MVKNGQSVLEKLSVKKGFAGVDVIFVAAAIVSRFLLHFRRVLVACWKEHLFRSKYIIVYPRSHFLSEEHARLPARWGNLQR